VIDVLDAVLALLEPDGSDVRRDDSAAEPFDYQPKTLYGWVSDDSHDVFGTGIPQPCVQENFEISLIYSGADDADQTARLKSRALSKELDAKAAAYAAAVNANRSRYANGTPAPWQDLNARVDHDLVVDRDVRGIGMRVRGYRFL
jgi:hypothetical protein